MVRSLIRLALASAVVAVGLAGLLVATGRRFGAGAALAALRPARRPGMQLSHAERLQLAWPPPTSVENAAWPSTQMPNLMPALHTTPPGRLSSCDGHDP